MSEFVMPNAVRELTDEQQSAIRTILTTSGLLTESGEVAEFSTESMPRHHKAFLDASISAIGSEGAAVANFSFPNPKCIVARIAEAAAVAACASVPGGQIAIAACIAAAHAVANEVCD